MNLDPEAKHYDVGGIETIEIISAKLTDEEYIGYLKGSVLKYLCRCGHKEDAKRDAGKAAVFLEWLIEEL